MKAAARTRRILFAHLLRGLAAASVLSHHYLYMIWERPAPVGQLIAQPALPAIVEKVPHFVLPDFGLPGFWGHFGVALFFLISGFVIPFSVAALSPRGFAVARALRIWPTYAVGLSIALLCVLLNARSAGVPFPYTAFDMVSHYLILPRWPLLARPIDGIIWTLEIELFFYAFCLVVSSRLKALERSIFLIALVSVPLGYAASLAFPAVLQTGWPFFPLLHWASSMMQFLPFLLVGTAFHYFHRGRLSVLQLLALQAGLLLNFVWSWRLGLMSADGWSGPLSYVIAYAVFSIAFVLRRPIDSLPRPLSWPLSGLADVSYPLYVAHGIFGYSLIAALLTAGFGAGTAIAVAIAAALALAVVIHVTIEGPTRALGKSLAAALMTPARQGEATEV